MHKHPRRNRIGTFLAKFTNRRPGYTLHDLDDRMLKDIGLYRTDEFALRDRNLLNERRFS